MKNIRFNYSPVGESALLMAPCEATPSSLDEVNDRLASLAKTVLQEQPDWLIDVVPSFQTLLITFDALKVDYHLVQKYLHTINPEYHSQNRHSHQIPVLLSAPEPCYPIDLNHLLKASNMSMNQFVKRYCERVYKVYTIGFLPNFAYLGHLPDELSHPRLKSPRSNVPAGAVAIADKQTAIYPKASSGGWNIIGYTPVVECFGNDTVFAVGDMVSFHAITLQEYKKMTHQAENN